MKKKNINVAFLIDWISSPYHIELVCGLEEACRNENVNLITFIGGCLNSPKNYDLKSNYIFDLISADYIDGIIIESGLQGLYSTKDEIAGFLERFKPIPVVSLSEKLLDIPSITIENSRGLENIILHLIDHHKFKTIAFIAGPHDNTDSQERLDTYMQTLKKRRIEFNPDLLLPGTFVNKSGKEAVRILLDERNIIPQAIVAANDDMALGAMEELQARKIWVPEEIAVVGFDDQKDSAYKTPALTTVRRPIFKLGETAVGVIKNLIERKHGQRNIELSTEPVIRQSCGCPKSMNYIKESRSSSKAVCSLYPEDILSMLPIIDAYRNFGYTRNIGRMKEFLQYSFPGMGIKRCFYSVFRDSNIDAAELLLSYDNNRIELAVKGEKYRLADLIRGKFLSADKKFNLRLFSLVYDEKILGILGYETDRESTIMDSTLRTGFLLNIMTGLTIHNRIG